MNEILRNRIKTLREDMGLTLFELASEIGCNKSYLSTLENGKIKKPSAEILYKISNILGCDITYFLDEKRGRFPHIISEKTGKEFDFRFESNGVFYIDV